VRFLEPVTPCIARPCSRQEHRLEREPCHRGRSRPTRVPPDVMMAAHGCAGAPVRVTEYPDTDLLHGPTDSLRTDDVIVAGERRKPLSRARPQDRKARGALPALLVAVGA